MRGVMAALGIDPRCTCGAPGGFHEVHCNEVWIDAVHDRALADYTGAYRDRLHRFWHETLPEDFVNPFLPPPPG